MSLESPSVNPFEYFRIIGLIVGVFFIWVVIISCLATRIKPKAQRKPRV